MRMWRRNSTALWRDEAPNKRVACSVLRCHVSVLRRDAAVLRRDAGVLCCDAIVLCCGLSRRMSVDCCQDLGHDLVPPCCAASSPCCSVTLPCCYLSRRPSVDCDQDLGYDLVPPCCAASSPCCTVTPSCCVAVYRAARVWIAARTWATTSSMSFRSDQRTRITFQPARSRSLWRRCSASMLSWT